MDRIDLNANASLQELNAGTPSMDASQFQAEQQETYTYITPNSADVYQPLIDQQENYRPKYHCDKVWGRVDWLRAIE